MYVIEQIRTRADKSQSSSLDLVFSPSVAKRRSTPLANARGWKCSEEEREREREREERRERERERREWKKTSDPKNRERRPSEVIVFRAVASEQPSRRLPVKKDEHG